MFNWESTVRLASGYLKKVNLTGYNTVEDANAAARGQTGGGEIIITQRVHEAQPLCLKYEPESTVVYQEVDHSYMDQLEEDMYMYLCETAIRQGKEPPSVEDFYIWLEDNFD